ncbi:MAG TPA: ABC transporter permease [Polyangia bacterium]|nr:ABC transporter permease [Polyangia bacterium]
MPVETFIGWRYLFRRDHGRWIWLAFALAIAAFVASGLAFLHLSGPAAHLGPGAAAPVAPVVGIILSGLAIVVCGLLLFFSVFTTVSVTGVMIGVSALLVVLGVTSGFQEQFKEKVLGVNAHVIVMKWGPDFSDYPELTRKLLALPGVTGAEPFVFNEMQAARGTAQAGVLLKGIDPEASLGVLDVGRQMVEGSVGALKSREPGILIGKELAHKLRAHLGDTVKLLSPLSAIDTAFLGKGQNLPRSGDFKVVGIFDAGFHEYDVRMVYLKLADAQRLVGRGDVVSGLELKLSDPDRAAPFARKLEKTLAEPNVGYHIIDWEELNHNLFTALRLQKVIISLFLTFIIVVAAFNIVASLTMIVLSKRKEIAILKSMGATSGAVAGLFQVTGLTIGAFGVCAGIGFGLLLCAVAARYGYPLDPKIYLISKLPVHVRALEVVLTAGVTLLICLLATIYPCVRAFDLKPVEGLRYE